MAEILPKGSPLGIRWTTAITTATTTSFDLSAFAGRYVKLTADQNCYFGWSTHAHGNAAGPGDLTLAGDVTAEQRVTSAAGDDLGYKVVADDLDAGSAGVQRVVDPEYPFLLVRAKTSNTALFKAKVTSDKAPGA